MLTLGPTVPNILHLLFHLISNNGPSPTGALFVVSRGGIQARGWPTPLECLALKPPLAAWALSHLMGHGKWGQLLAVDAGQSSQLLF